MLFWSIKWICISLLLIALVHYLYSFFKNTLTIPKMRDLVNKPLERYKEIYSTIDDKKVSSSSSSSTSEVLSYAPPVAVGSNDMQNELKQFLDNLHKKDDVVSHSLGSNNNAFASYS